MRPVAWVVAASALLTAASAAADPSKPTQPGAPAPAPAPKQVVHGPPVAIPPAVKGPGLSAVPLRPRGYAIRTRSFTAASGVQTRGQVRCPFPKVPFGGGVVIVSNDLSANINSSFPSRRRWVADVNNNSGSSTSFTVYVICARRPTNYGVFTNSFTSPANVQTSGTVNCPSNTVPLGGGVLSSSASVFVNINSLLPQANGWRADMNNATGTATSFTVYAVCGRRPAAYNVQAGPSEPNPAFTESFADVTCAGSTVPIGGGGLSSSGNTAVNMNSTFPTTSPFGWRVFENNATSSDFSLTAYVVCA